MGLSVKCPSVLHRCMYCSDAFAVIRALNPVHPPASTSPRIGISSAPAQISTNCSTSLKIADRSPPSATQIATVRDDTQMLRLMFQPSTIFNTSAIAYMLMPLINTVMNAKLTEDSARLGSPNLSFRYPGTECVFEM